MGTKKKGEERKGGTVSWGQCPYGDGVLHFLGIISSVLLYASTITATTTSATRRQRSWRGLERFGEFSDSSFKKGGGGGGSLISPRSSGVPP